MTNIKDFVRGSGPEVTTGYRRGDSWIQTAGPHTDCEGKVFVIGPGVGLVANGYVDGVLVRCGGCFLSWVIR